jgi:HKD family nuclease
MGRARGPQDNAVVPAEVLIFPYTATRGRSLLSLLIDELKSHRWDRFQAAVAFAKASGNYQDLLNAQLAFAQSGGKVELTFGADRFGPESLGSDYQAIEGLLQALDSQPTVRVTLYHEEGRTFHPKLYLFSNAVQRKALLVVGSSNWSSGGFFDNVEANVALTLNLQLGAHRQIYDPVQRCFEDYWKEA